MGATFLIKQRSKQSSDENPEDQVQTPIWRPWEENSKIERTVSVHFPCNYIGCDSFFRRDSERRRHEQSVHSKTVENCGFCYKPFTRKDNLTRHIKMKHKTTAEKPKCQFCNKILSRQDAVKRHIQTCAGKTQKRRKALKRLNGTNSNPLASLAREH